MPHTADLDKNLIIMKKIIILSAAIILVLSSCKHEKKDNQLINLVDTLKVKTVDTQLVHSIEMEQKTVVIDTPSVVFFMPNYKERQQIIRFYGEYNRFNFEQIFSNFRRLALDAEKALTKYHIKSYLTYSWKFDIKTDTGYVHFDRKQQKEIIGFIIADGHKPPIMGFGVYKYIDLQKLIQDYFQLKDFQMLDQPANYQTDSLPKAVQSH